MIQVSLSRLGFMGTLAIMGFAVSACGEKYFDNRIAFGGILFDGRVTQSETDPKSFDLVIRNAVQNVDAARDAARYEGTKFCIEQFGTSDIDWAHGPEDAPQMSDGHLLLNGSCKV
jgi:hypothetical protein